MSRGHRSPDDRRGDDRPGDDRPGNASSTGAAGLSDPDFICLRFGLFSVAMSAGLVAAMAVVRIGLPTPLLAYATGPAILACATLGPGLWAARAPDRVLWLGPLALAGLLLGCILVALGLPGLIVLLAAAPILLIRAVWALYAPGIRPRDAVRWAALLLLALVMAVILTTGNKYLNYIADQLMLAGRTDGDILMHAAMANSIRYFHFPSTGIDGLEFTHYHFGLDVLGALLARGTGLDVVLALMGLRTLTLFPLMVFGAAWGGLVVVRRLLPRRAPSTFALTCAAVVIVLFLQDSWAANLAVVSDPLLLSGVFMILLAPAILWLLSGTPEAGRPPRSAWWLALLAIPLLSAAKISTGYVWTGLVGFWALRLIGPRRPGFWIVAAAMAAVFLPCYLLFTDRAGAGAAWFGTPYFVERGFAKGNYLLPFQVHFQALFAIACLAALKTEARSAPRRFLIEALAIALLVGILPGLLMEIPGADAFYFTQSVGWLSVPILVAVLAPLPEWLREAPARYRRMGCSAITILTLAVLVSVCLNLPLQFQIFMANNALLRTGDRTYYGIDKARGWRKDARRALREIGVIGLFHLQPPAPLGKSLADALRAFKAETGSTGAAYIGSQSELWGMVSDCDGKATWPMSVAGLPAIDGFLPVQSACPQEFSLRGYGAAPAERPDLSDAELCTRAREKGFTTVLRVESLTDRSRDRSLTCP